MYRFKTFLEMENPFYGGRKPIPDIGGGGGGGFAPRPSRMAPALKYPDTVIAGKPGGSHSDLIPLAKDKGKPDAMGFVRKHSGDEDVGPYKGRFFDRETASKLGKRNSDLLSDPDQANDPPWQAQHWDFKPEGGKARKKIKEAIAYILEKEDKAKKKSPAKKKDKKSSLAIANKESMHGGKAFYGPGEC